MWKKHAWAMSTVSLPVLRVVTLHDLLDGNYLDGNYLCRHGQKNQRNKWHCSKPSIFVKQGILAFDMIYSKKFLYFVKSMFRRFPRISRQILLDVRGNTQITSDLGMGGGYRGIPKTRQPYWKGIPISLGIWVRGYPNHCDRGLPLTRKKALGTRLKAKRHS